MGRGSEGKSFLHFMCTPIVFGAFSIYKGRGARNFDVLRTYLMNDPYVRLYKVEKKTSENNAQISTAEETTTYFYNGDDEI